MFELIKINICDFSALCICVYFTWLIDSMSCNAYHGSSASSGSSTRTPTPGQFFFPSQKKITNHENQDENPKHSPNHPFETLLTDQPTIETKTDKLNSKVRWKKKVDFKKRRRVCSTLVSLTLLLSTVTWLWTAHSPGDGSSCTTSGRHASCARSNNSECSRPSRQEDMARLDMFFFYIFTYNIFNIYWNSLVTLTRPEI